jgi:hypothetical protein
MANDEEKIIPILVSLLSGKNIIDIEFVYKFKNNEKYYTK